MNVTTIAVDAARAEPRVHGRDLAGSIAESLRTLRDVSQHLRGPLSVDARGLDVAALARLDTLITLANDRATSIASALELQGLAAQKVRRVCAAGGVGSALSVDDDIRRELGG